ncbi:PEP-CTERM sorting domain-containing protein [bacterium]|nr:PEP-CTERM sorting domain-containing protein [bacterium]
MKTTVFAATASLALGLLAAPASAIDLVPQQEGEVNVGLGCYSDNCVALPSFIKSIASLQDATSGTRSRLFVDVVSTANKYGSTEFLSKDAGTNSEGFWFRPSEYNESTGYSEEKGQLEVGTFTISFTKMMKELTVDFFDVEKAFNTGILAINGQSLETADFMNAGANSNIQSRTLSNVSSITLKLGWDDLNGTGDGANFRMDGVPVPEPASIFGLLAIGGLGAGSLLKNKKQ